MTVSNLTRLIDAIETGDINTIQNLLPNCGKFVNETDANGRLALYTAAEKGNSDALRILLEHPNIDVNKGNANHYSRSALNIAAVIGHTEIVRLLAANPDVNLNKASLHGNTP
eukprot:223457_1